MAPLVACLLAVLAAAGPEPEPPLPAGGPMPREALAAQAALPEGALAEAFPNVAPVLGETVAMALPPPPERVVRATYFGTVTIDHPAHLARRSPCRSCHGSGPVSKIVLTPKLAHERCRGCHHERQRGPTSCRGCHVVPPPAPASPVPEAAALAQAPGAGTAAAAEEDPAAVSSPPPRGGVLAELASAEVRRGKRFERTVMVGFATAGDGGGVAVRLASRQGKLVFTEGIERVSGSDEKRTVALAGAGLATPVHPEIELQVTALGGLDAVDEPTLAFRPALAARCGLRWRPTHRWIVEAIDVSFTGVLDLTGSGPPGVERPGRAAAFTTVSIGLPLPRR